MNRRFWNFLGSLCLLTVLCTAPSEQLLADSPNSAPTSGRAGLGENYLPVQRLSAEGSRGSGVDLAAGPDGTVWLLWAEKGAAQPDRGHASADDLYIAAWSSGAPVPGAPIRVNSQVGEVKSSAQSRLS